MKEKKNKGITLIALVITIIVLLILAGVTLSTLFGNNGILTESQLAVEANKEANAEEQVQLAWAACETEYQSAWTKDSSVEKSSYFQKENLNRNLGTGTVKSVNYVENGKSTVTYTLDGTEYEFEITSGQVYKVGQAPDVTEPTPDEPQQPGTLVKSITAANYGDKIQYGIDINENGDLTDDWSIFYKDDNGTFIIVNEYFPVEGNLLKDGSGTNISTLTGMKRQPPYEVYWDTFNKNGASNIDTNVANLFKMGWLNSYPDSINNNIKAVANLMDTTAWSHLVTTEVSEKGGMAIGGPTLEMWVASVNQKYTDEEIIYCNSNNLGYYIGTKQDTTSTTYVPSTGMHSDGTIYDSNTAHKVYLDKLYYPYRYNYNGSCGYFITSPGANSSEHVMAIDYDGYLYGVNLNFDETNEWSHRSVRPLVYIPSSVNGKKNESGIWELSF